MSLTSAVGSQASATTLLKTYSALDTNKDGVVSQTELAAAANPPQKAEADEREIPTATAADRLSNKVAAAIIDVQAVDAGKNAAPTIQDALSAYLASE